MSAILCAELCRALTLLPVIKSTGVSTDLLRYATSTATAITTTATTTTATTRRRRKKEQKMNRKV